LKFEVIRAVRIQAPTVHYFTSQLFCRNKTMADFLLFSATAAGYLYIKAAMQKSSIATRSLLTEQVPQEKESLATAFRKSVSFNEKESSSDAAPQASRDEDETETSMAEMSDVILATEFPSLSQSISRAPILGLYFAASWCGDCDAVTPALAKVIASQKNDEVLVHIVYVSSDTSANEMAAYKPEQFSAVPWEAEKERSSIKRFFGTCAGKERESLGMALTDRKHGTPTLILLDTQSGLILTESGAEQVESMESAESVLEEWQSMLFAGNGNSSWETIASDRTFCSSY
jgi:thiol-disulfide isomerase/thioredoxin